MTNHIAGTATGGGTFWGLGKLLTGARDFDELLSLAEQGDHRKVDMLVKDIYGADYTALGLPADLIASSFGNIIKVGLLTKILSITSFISVGPESGKTVYRSGHCQKLVVHYQVLTNHMFPWQY